MASRKPAKSPRKAARKTAKAGRADTKARGRARPSTWGKVAAYPDGPGHPPSGTLVPRLAVDDCAKAIGWYERAFGAKELHRQPGPDGKIRHATLKVGSSWVYVSDVFPGSDTEHPISLGGTTTNLHLHVQDLERAWARAVTEGAVVTFPLANLPWGDRYGKLRDPFGHVWAMSWPVDLTAAEKARLKAEAVKTPEPGA